MDSTEKALAAMDEGRGKTVQPKNDAETKKVRDLLPRSVETADDIDELLEALAPTKCGCGATEPCEPYKCGPLIQGGAPDFPLQHPRREHYEGPDGHWSENSAFYECYHTVECPAHRPHDIEEWGLTGPEVAAERDARHAIRTTLTRMPEEAHSLLTDPERYFRILRTLRKAASPTT